MYVTIVDRAAMDAEWGTSAFPGVMLCSVRIDDKCPSCGGTRGTPEKRRFHEFGEFYSVDTWRNPCGHVDKYTAVLKESRQRKPGLATLSGSAA